MAIQYSNVGNPVTQALGGLTQYLMIENQRLDQENKEKKINLAAEQIADRYQNLPPDATIADIQKLQYQLIEDAAAIGGLQENLPLISSLYQSTMAGRELQKNERRDSALQQYIADKYGVTGDFGGQIAMGLAQFKRQGEHGYDVMGEDGTSRHVIFDEGGNKIFETNINDAGFNTQWYWKKKEMDYGYQQDLGKMKFKQQLDLEALSGTAGMPSFSGFDLMTTVKGVGGETLYKHHKNGGTYYLDPTTNKLKPFWGDYRKVSTVSDVKQVRDVLDTYQKNAETFAPQRLGYLQALNKNNKSFIEDLVGPLAVDEKNGDLTLGAVGQLDTFLQSPDAEAKLAEVYGDLNDEEKAAVGDIMGKYTASLSNQMYFQDVIRSSMPTSEYDGKGLISDTDYEKSSMALFQVFGGQVPEYVSAPIMKYIADTAGINVNGVNEQTFRNLSRREQEKIMKRIIPYINYTE